MELADEQADMGVEFEVAGDHDPEEFSARCLLEGGVLYRDGQWWGVLGLEENGVLCFGWIWNKIVQMEICYEVGKLGLS